MLTVVCALDVNIVIDVAFSIHLLEIRRRYGRPTVPNIAPYKIVDAAETPVGQVVNPCLNEGYTKTSCNKICIAKSVVTERTIAAVQKRLDWFSSFLSQTFRIKTSVFGVHVEKYLQKRYPPGPAQSKVKGIA